VPKAKVKLGLKDKSVVQKIAQARAIVKAMTGNATFPTPAPALNAVGNAVNKLETDNNALANIRQQAQAQTVIVAASETALDGLLTNLGGYVETVANGEETKIRSAGMDVRSGAAPVGQLPAPTDLNATTGDRDGEIDLQWNRVNGAKSYVVELTTDTAAATGWKSAGVATKSKQIVTGLTTGTKYWFRVAAIGAAGQSPWSDPATKIAP
jgi:hypothetical protein